MPNTREKERLIELLDEIACKTDDERCRKCVEQDCVRCAYENVADHLIANGVTVQKWIPVSERLPEYEKTVMGWDAELRDMGIVNFIYGQFFDIVDMSEVNVTHWMPLPAPPHTKQEEAVTASITENTMAALSKMGQAAHGGKE